MATRKSTTRGKTKTAKKPATKKVTAKKTTAAAATRKKVTTKKTDAKTTITKKTTTRGRGEQLRILAILTLVLSVITAALAVFYMQHNSYQLVTPLQTKDELLSKSSTVLVPAVRAAFDIELRWLIVATMALGALVPALILTRLKDYYAAGLRNKASKLRWIDTAIVSALMVETIALISGVNDLMSLKLIGGLMLTTAALGYLAETQNISGKAPRWGAYYLSLFTGMLPWVVIAVAAASTVIYGGVRAPWYVYAVYVTTFIGFMGYVMTQVRQFRGLQDYEATEQRHLQISLFTRLAFALILVIGLLK